MNITNIQLLIELIEQQNTGNPAELAKKLAVSERMIYKYLDILKSEFNAPIKYNHSQKTYYFTEAGSLDLRWQDGEK
jgi:transcriptional antiterminator